MDVLEVQGDQSSLPLDKLAAIYIKIRDAKDKLTADYKQQCADLEEQMSVLEAEIALNNFK